MARRIEGLATLLAGDEGHGGVSFLARHRAGNGVIIVHAF